MGNIGNTGSMTLNYISPGRVDVVVQGSAATKTIAVTLNPRSWTNPDCWIMAADQIFLAAIMRHGSLAALPPALNEVGYPGVVTYHCP